MRCPSCGARNADSATWCTQCYAGLGTAAAAAEPPTATGPTTATGPPPVAEPSPVTEASTGRAARDVREIDGQVEWRCSRCAAWTPLHERSCATCGATRTGFASETEATPRAVPVGGAVAASVVVPGAGHLLLGATGSGLARLVLALLWAAGGVAILTGTGGSVIGAILLVGAGTLWVVSVLDVTRLAADEAEVLDGRRLGALVLVVTLALVVAAAVTAVGAAR